MRCLPPVAAPIPNDFAEFAVQRGQEVTKPLLYRLSYVGADFLKILACAERKRSGPDNRCSAGSETPAPNCCQSKALY